MYMVPLSPKTSPQHTSLHFKTKSLTHKSRQFTPHNITYLPSIPTCSPLLVTTFLTPFLNVFSLQAKDASKPAVIGSSFWMVLFTKERLPISNFAGRSSHNQGQFSTATFTAVVQILFDLTSQTIQSHRVWSETFNDIAPIPDTVRKDRFKSVLLSYDVTVWTKPETYSHLTKPELVHQISPALLIC